MLFRPSSSVPMAHFVYIPVHPSSFRLYTIWFQGRLKAMFSPVCVFVLHHENPLQVVLVARCKSIVKHPEFLAHLPNLFWKSQFCRYSSAKHKNISLTMSWEVRPAPCITQARSGLLHITDLLVIQIVCRRSYGVWTVYFFLSEYHLTVRKILAI